MEEYKALLKERLDFPRYAHSLGVADTARELAVRYRVNSEKAYLAGILHDYAKNLSDTELLQIAQENDLILDEIELKAPQLLHGPVGAFLIEKDLGISNKDILNAVRYHTTGCPNMELLTQILYIADYIEPNRKFPGVEKLRKLTYENLTLGVLEGLNQTLKYVLSNRGLIHCLSVQARNWLLLNEEG